MASSKIIYITISVILIIVINIIPSENFFGAYYINLYIILPLFLMQLSTLLFYKKYTILTRIINILIIIILMFITYKFIINS